MIMIQATGVDYNRFGLLDQKLRLLEDDIDGFSISKMKHPPSVITFSLSPVKAKYVKNISLLTGLEIRYVQGLDAASKIQSKTSFRSVVESFSAGIRDDAIVESSSPSMNKKSIRHLDSLGAIVTPSKDFQGINYYANEWDEPKTGNREVGPLSDFSDLPDRPWEWEVDAALLEALADEDEYAFDLDGIQARAIAPLESFAIHDTLQRIHDSNKYPVAMPPSADKLQSIKLRREKVMLRQSSLLGVLEADSDDERSDMDDDEFNIDRPDAVEDDAFHEEEEGGSVVVLP